MQHYFDKKNIELKTDKGTAVALGKFDGFHSGHMLLINEIKRLQDKGFTGVIFTFDLKQNSVFNIDSIKNILTSDEKYELAEQLGIDVMIEYPFDDSFAGMEPELFVKNILADMLHARYVIVGEDYRFGKKRQGDVKLLKALSDKYKYEVIPFKKKRMGEITVSSSYIRSLIEKGEIREVQKFLGRPYYISGHVVHGKELGRTIQVPTANLLLQKRKIYPVSGVYASEIIMCTGETFYGITNIGDNPTVNNDRRVTIETHIFDFEGDIYGEKITVRLLDFIRPEIKFRSVEELKSQMLKDMEKAREYM